MAKSRLATSVYRGLALLDEKRPGWTEEVDPEALAMGSTDACVLGQIFSGEATRYDAEHNSYDSEYDGESGFSYGSDILGIYYTANEYGFDISPPRFRADHYRVLTRIWRYAIRQRQGTRVT